MLKPAPLFFIGWDYTAPASVVLKRALMDPDFPWKAVAIVHDVLLTDNVDTIPLMQTDEFLAREDLSNSDVLLLVKDGVQRAIWMRRVREHGMRLVDQGELLQGYAADLARRKMTRTLGLITLPQAFDDTAHRDLQRFSEQWPDPLSNRTFGAYLSFLQSGLMASLSAVVTTDASEHPFFMRKDPYSEAFKAIARNGMIWEIADTRSAFLEQAVVHHNIGGFAYGFSSFSAGSAQEEGTRLALLLGGLGIKPALSSLHASDTAVRQDHVGTAATPDSDANNKFVRIDVEEPVAVLKWLDHCTENLLAKVRLRRPSDLLQCLGAFPIGQLSLRCDRPGPAGLELTFAKLQSAAADVI
ncbi:hypothetical protein [Xanthomonas sp. 4461]|uniref:hypothetical protein n=1 Tax=Xanthomonas sp. 4461 TaxID=3035313 RepID=UPI00216A496D|nr:hypothetical protein [Xanthomonas sp. 4461]MCS3810974.1 hypothetical protein [Xanthomonas sp. 4461]